MCMRRGVSLCGSFVHKPPCPYWIYHGSPDATLIRMCKTMLSVVVCDIAAVCDLQSKHKAFSYKRKCRTPAKDAATQEHQHTLKICSDRDLAHWQASLYCHFDLKKSSRL